MQHAMAMVSGAVWSHRCPRSDAVTELWWWKCSTLLSFGSSGGRNVVIRIVQLCCPSGHAVADMWWSGLVKSLALRVMRWQTCGDQDWSTRLSMGWSTDRNAVMRMFNWRAPWGGTVTVMWWSWKRSTTGCLLWPTCAVTDRNVVMDMFY